MGARPLFGGNRLGKSLVLLVLFLFAVSGCDVLSCSCEQGWGRGWGGGMSPSLRKACTHRNKHASAHVAWPKLVADVGKKRLASNMSIPANMNLLEPL